MAQINDTLKHQEEGMVSSPRKSWRKSILGQLRYRNQREVAPFEDLINLHNRIVERISSLQMENTQLLFINEKLKEEIRNLRISTSDTPKGDSAKNVQTSSAEDIVMQSKIATLEKKLFSVQEELTELHRRKGIISNLPIEINNSLYPD